MCEGVVGDSDATAEGMQVNERAAKARGKLGVLGGTTPLMVPVHLQWCDRCDPGAHLPEGLRWRWLN